MVGKRQSGADDAAVPTISALIEGYRTRTGASYEKIAEAAGTTKQTIHNAAHRRLKEWPEPTTLAGMAKALGHDITTIVLGYARELGLDVTREISGLAALLPPGATQLTARQQGAILSVVGAMLSPVEDSGATVTKIAAADKSRPAQPTATKQAARRGESRGKRERGSGD